MQQKVLCNKILTLPLFAVSNDSSTSVGLKHFSVLVGSIMQTNTERKPWKLNEWHLKCEPTSALELSQEKQFDHFSNSIKELCEEGGIREKDSIKLFHVKDYITAGKI